MTTPKLNQKHALAWRAVFTATLVAVTVLVLTRYWVTVSSSLRIARSSNVVWLVVALLSAAATFWIAALVYDVLALHRLRYRQTLLVELASAFVNRLLPAGLGGLGLNGVYLYRRGHTPAEATAVVSVNNLLGISAHLALLAGLLLYEPDVVRALFTKYHIAVPWGWAIAAGVLLCLVWTLPATRNKTATFTNHLFASVRKIGPPNIVRALVLSAFTTTAYTLALLAAARAVDIHLGVLQIFIVFTAGELVGTATPTPGGLVGAEAGLFTGFVAYSVPPATAGAAVLLFRLATYWLPLFPGMAALLAVRQRKLS